MILSDRTIAELISSDHNNFNIKPFKSKNVQPASIDLTLGDHFLSPDGPRRLDFDTEIEYITYVQEEIVIHSKSFLLATTDEYVTMPENITAFVEGRSSIGRMGLFVQNAGWIDCGFEGEITLELYNASNFPIILQAGRRICQLVFAYVDQIPENVYSGKYQGQVNATGSRIYEDNY